MRLVLLSFILLLWVAPAHAGTVAIVQRPHQTPALVEALTRIHGELLSVGLEVRLIARPAERGFGPADSRAWLESIAAEGQIDAVIDVVGDVAPTAVDVWVFEKAPRRLTVSRIALEPNATNTAETLAIRAVEVLRSTFLERDMVARERRSSASAVAGSAPATTPTSTSMSTNFPRRSLQNQASGQTERFGIAAGAAVLTGLDGIGPALLPTANVDWRVRNWFDVQAAFAGFGTEPTVSRLGASARIAQQYGLFGGCFGLHSHGPLRPFLAVSAGALRTSISGQADAPRQGHEATRWSLLLDAGMGAALQLTERYSISLAAHAQIAEPYVAIHIIDQLVATSGRPNVALTLTVGAWL